MMFGLALGPSFTHQMQLMVESQNIQEVSGTRKCLVRSSYDWLDRTGRQPYIKLTLGNGTRPQKECSQVSDMQIKIHKYGSDRS